MNADSYTDGVCAETPPGSAAPWIELTAAGSADITAICVRTNARVLEVHGGQEPLPASDAPLLTHEAEEEEEGSENGSVFLHYLCGGEGSPLLPAGAACVLKLFGRRPKTEVRVDCVCVVVTPVECATVAATATELNDEENKTSANNADGGGWEAVALRLTALQQTMMGGMTAVMHRLGSLEKRMAAVEYAVLEMRAPPLPPPATSEKKEEAQHTTAPADSSDQRDEGRVGDAA